MAEDNGNVNNNPGYNNVFNKLEKFDGKDDLASWLRTFERACTIAQKTDDLVKGQLLMLCLSGQALAVAEQLEEEKGAQQKFTEQKGRLESVFNTTASKEAKMVEFENRVQRVEESVDEFMLSLVKIYRAATPDATEGASALDIKRKFMHGISSELRRSIYIFCNEPYAADITYQKLLENARKANLQLADQQKDITSPIVAINDNVATRANDVETNLMQAINNLERNFNQRIDSLERQRYDAEGEINYIGNNNRGSSNRNNSRAQHRNYNRGRGNYSNSDTSDHRTTSRNAYNNTNNYNNSSGTNNRSSQNTNSDNREPIRCWKCNGENHIARYCYSKN